MNILLAIDGTKSSECVFNLLKNIIITRDSEIIILSAAENIIPMMNESLSGAFYECEAELAELQAAAAQKLVVEAKKKIQERYGCYVKTEVVTGSAKYVIVEKAKERNSDLIILGSHNYRLWERVLLGSVSTFVAQNAECSVLISRCDHTD